MLFEPMLPILRVHVQGRHTATDVHRCMGPGEWWKSKVKRDTPNRVGSDRLAHADSNENFARWSLFPRTAEVGPGSKEFIAGANSSERLQGLQFSLFFILDSKVETNFTLQLRDAFGNAVPHVDGVKVPRLILA